MSHQMEYLTVRGTKIRILKGGKGDPLLFLHGANGLEKWGTVIDELSRNYTVYCPEHPGYGSSDIDHRIDSVEDLAFFYLDVLEELQLDQVVLAGHSLGGWLAVELAILSPGKVKKIVLIDAVGIRVEGVKTPDIFMMKTAEKIDYAYYLTECKELALRNLEEVDELNMEQLKNRRATAHLAWNPYFHNPKILDRIHRITMPVQIIWGQEDALFPIKYGEEYHKLIPHSKFEVIAESGHYPHHEQPDKFLSKMNQFLKQEVKQ